MSTKIVCVVNNFEIFESVVKNNGSLTHCEIISYDNSSDNVSITKRYNDFINDYVLNTEQDFWCFFVHQDFGFMESIEKFLSKLDKNAIYGTIGVKSFGNKALEKLGLSNKIKIKGKGRLKLPFGQILQGNNDFNFHKYGFEVFTQMEVDSVDCCCIMIHSSLIRKHNLLFDENLSFHLYAEELCYRAKNELKIKTKVVQAKCFHMGRGNIDEVFCESLNYLQVKFKTSNIPSTCPT